MGSRYFSPFPMRKQHQNIANKIFFKVTDHIVGNKILRLLFQKMMMIYDF